MIYNELMSDFEMDEKDFAADSWSLAVDSSFLQQHKKEVMKQQDVIYGEPGDLLPQACPPSHGPSVLARWSLGPCWHPTRCLWASALGARWSPSLCVPPILTSALCPFHTEHPARACGEPRHGEGDRRPHRGQNTL